VIQTLIVMTRTVLESLLCSGFTTCVKQHKNGRSLQKVDDVVPLLTRNIAVSSKSSGCESSNALNHLF